MNLRPEVRKRWVDALRSGDWPQTRGRLHDGEGYCCLGVLCELAIADGVEITKVADADTGDTTYDGIADMPPRSVTKWAKEAEWTALDTWKVRTPRDLQLRSEFAQIDLTYLNDVERMPFDQIADAIEQDGKNQS